MRRWCHGRRWATQALLATSLTSLLFGNPLSVGPQPAMAQVKCPPPPSPSPTPSPSPSPTPQPPPPPPSGPRGLTLGELRLSATFNSIGIEVTFSGDANANADAQVKFKQSSDTRTDAWRDGLPLWRTPDAFYGSVLLLKPGTAYDIQVTLQDRDGVSGAHSGTMRLPTQHITTRSENIPAASTLVPTRFVSPTGSDSNPGTSPGAAWQSLDKALQSAPPGAVVQVAPGDYTAPPRDHQRTSPLTLTAEFPAVDDAHTSINPGRHSVIDSGVVSRPATTPESRVWKAWRVFPDPAQPNRNFTVWKWPAPGLDTIDQLGYAPTREAEPKRLAHWAQDSADLATPAGWAAKLSSNRTYNYGFYVEPHASAAGAALYARLPGDLDPNTLYMTVGGAKGLQLNGPDIRVSGFEVRLFGQGLEYGANATRGVIDHNQLESNLEAIEFVAKDAPEARYGADHVVEYNRITDTSLWTANPAKDPGIPWTFIKQQITNADCRPYPTRRLGGKSESTAIHGTGGAHRVVVRRNLVDGTFNGIVPSFANHWLDRYAGQDMDVYDNTIRHIADDALEPEGPVINLRAWNNRISQASVVLSTAPLEYGPVYLFRNQGWCLGATGVPSGADGKGSYGGSGISTFFKYSGTSTPQGRVFVLHNTLTTDAACSPTAVSGGEPWGSSGPSHEAFYLRNNIISASFYAFDVASVAMWDEDANSFTTTDTTRGLQCLGKRFTINVDAYRALCSPHSRTNVGGDFISPPRLTNPSQGDLRLPEDSPLIDAGTPVPNISDRPGLDFRGVQPDLGARERS